MKKNSLLVFIAFISLLWLSPAEAFSQKKGGGPLPWAPAHGYRAKTRHIYFPDHNFYYDMQKGTYIYLSTGRWVFAAKLPSIFGNINLGTSRQVELDINDRNPQHYNADHLVQYKARHHSPYKKKSKGQGNGHGNGHGRGKGKGR